MKTEIKFTKLQGDENDFLLSWGTEVTVTDLPEAARRICARTTGIGADGWMLAWREDDALRTRLFNSDGSEAEISGNGTRCAAAFALMAGVAQAPNVKVFTAAGEKKLRVISQTTLGFLFEMDMGVPKVEALHETLHLAGSDYDATVLNVGNPQCAIFVDELPQHWLQAAAEAEGAKRFPNRTNVSFVRPLDRHTVEAVFYERGAGETRSSGTGSTGAATAAILRKVVESPVSIRTPAGALSLRWDDSVYLTGPAEMVGHGSFFVEL